MWRLLVAALFALVSCTAALSSELIALQGEETSESQEIEGGDEAAPPRGVWRGAGMLSRFVPDV